MNLLRKMSSKMRSTSALSASGEPIKKGDAPVREDEEEEEVESVLEQDPDQDDTDEFKDAAAAPEGQSEQKGEDAPIRVRAPVSDEQDDDDDGGDRDEEEEFEEDEGGGRVSHDSAESFDSALERMAASSDASYDTALSPKISSPVGSLPGQGGIENPSTSTDPTKSEDPIDSEQNTPKAENNDDARSVRASPSIKDQSMGPPSPMPKAKITADDDDLDEGSDDEADEKGEEIQEDQPQSSKKEAIGVSESEKSPKPVPNSNGGLEEHPEDGQQEPAARPAMPMAKLSAEDEDVIEERDDDELEDPEEQEEPVEEEAGGDDGPVKIRAVPSDLDDNVVLPYVSPPPELDEDNDENSPPAKVPSEGTEGIQTRPSAKLSDDESSSPEDQPDAQPTSSGSPTAVSRELPDNSAEEPEEAGAGKVDESDRTDDDKGGAEMEDFLRNLNDAEDGDGEDEDEDEDEEEGDEDEEENEEDEDGFMERSEALAALLRGAEAAARDEAAGAAPSMGSAGPSLPARPTRNVRSSLPSLDTAARTAPQPRSVGDAPIRSSSQAEESNEPADGNEETREKLQSIRVKFLRLALRLGQSHHNVVVAQVLYRLGLAEQLRGGRASRTTAFSFDRASSIAEEQERAGQGELDFACTIMILGKTGVGKSATINSIFDEAKTKTNAFGPSTSKVQIITGHVHGIKVRVIDTPGLLPSLADQRHNERVMGSVKNFIKKESPDIVLYFDRLDMQSRDFGDLPLLRTITDTFGAPVWFNAIVVLTHASSAPPDGPNGVPLSYEMFVAQRSHVVQQTIRQAAGDMRLMNPVSLVENHAACRVNRTGDRVLPNGHVWKPQLLLLCFASKILAEANTLLKLQDNTPGRPFGQRSRVPPLPFLLSSLLQSRAPLKMPDEQLGDEDESEDDDDSEDDDSEDEEDYDQLPPFRRLAKEEVAELDEINRAEYFEELVERERLFQRKQWKEELKRRRELKKRMAEAPADQAQLGEELGEEDVNRFAAVPVPMPDMVLPPSFDSDNPSHRYRYLETANQWLVRPVLETHGWDHDNGYDGMSVEKMFVLRDKIPTSVSGQITKDKKEANMNMECAASVKHGEGKVTLAGVDLQTVGKDLAYTLRSETRFSNFKGNKTTGGLALTLLGDTVSAGMKIEDRLIVGRRVKVVVNGGAITGGGDIAYGGSLEASLRDKDYPLSRTLSTLGVSIMDWHGDLAVGGNLQSQFVLGKTVMVGRANLNNRGAGQISIRASSSEQLQMALIGVLPIVRSILNRLFGQSQQ